MKNDFKADLLDAAFAVHKVLYEAERKIRRIEYDEKINKNCLFQMQEVAKQNEQMVRDLVNLVDAQGIKGTWDASPYHTGLFNGLELALSIFEKREPQYREHPDQIIGFGQKPTKHLDDVLGAYGYITDRNRVFQSKNSQQDEVGHD